MPNATPKLDVLISPFGTEPQPILSLAVHAERAGFDGVWTYDHMTGNMFDRGSSLDAFTLLGAIAGATERVQLGPLVANVINRHPVRLALIANTLHRLSGGRAEIGIGTGAAPGARFSQEHETLGTELGNGAERRERLIEAIALMRALWAGATEFSGTYYSVDDFDFGLVNDSPPPIIIGASGPQTAELAFAHGDGLNMANPEALVRLGELIEANRSDSFEVSVHVALSTDNPTTFDEQLPEPSELVDRWVFAVPASTSVEAIDQLRESVSARFG